MKPMVHLLIVSLSALLAAGCGGKGTASAVDVPASEPPPVAEDEPEAKPGRRGPLTSIGALALGPAGVLFAADPVGTKVYALHIEPPSPSGEGVDRVEDIDSKIASMLGTTERNIFIKDMEHDSATGTTYLSLDRGQGEAALPVLVRVLRDGTIEEVPLDSVRHEALAITNAPAADEEVWKVPKRTLTVTDMKFIDGELFIAGLSNEGFESTLRRARYPFEDGIGTTELEIYHGAHGKYETHAPIFAFIPYELQGKTHLLAGYLCTPLVTFDINDVRSKDKLRGKTIAELGFGSAPTDILAYEYGGERHVVVLNSRRGPMKISHADLLKAQERPGITEEVGPRSGVDYLTPGLTTAVQVEEFDKDHLIVLDRSIENGALSLQKRGKRWL